MNYCNKQRTVECVYGMYIVYCAQCTEYRKKIPSTLENNIYFALSSESTLVRTCYIVAFVCVWVCACVLVSKHRWINMIPVTLWLEVIGENRKRQEYLRVYRPRGRVGKRCAPWFDLWCCRRGWRRILQPASATSNPISTFLNTSFCFSPEKPYISREAWIKEHPLLKEGRGKWAPQSSVFRPLDYIVNRTVEAVQ